MIDLSIHMSLGWGSQVFELDVEAQIGKGEIIHLQGDSGAGKTTLLRAIAGLHKPKQGYISIDGQMVYSQENHVPVGIRDVAMQLQELGLFPSKSIERNIGYCYSERCPLRIQEMLDVLELDAFRRKKPYQVSGGQRQRAGFARTLAQGRTVLLLDEPFNALDEQMRLASISLLEKYQKAVNGVVLITSHHADDLSGMATREIGLEKGKIAYDRQVNPERSVAFMSGRVVDILKGDRFVIVVEFQGENVHMPCSAEMASAVSIGQELSLQYDVGQGALRVS